ncbi:MAG: alpha-L-fucosidase [Gemmatimonadales bacterium]|jgi:alpha-L-fucosidase
MKSVKSMTTALALLALTVQTVGAQQQRYEPNWESISSRPTPEWWRDAKFGIFIHWGVYSVPAISPRENYSEWYWRWLEDPDRIGPMARDFHLEHYGADFEYFDFAPMFKAELFEPGDWARLFEAAGARYVVLTSKHHDGFALWPSAEASATWGRPWNSVEIGPGRDLVGELTDAVRERGLKMGLYYSVYEWFNPLYLSDPKAFALQHYHPQFKDLVTRYAPSVIFADGAWDHGDDVWHSAELVAWLLNDSPSRDDVAINDRWYGGGRGVHGGYFTTEYGSGFETGRHAWEESRAIGRSYGYNRIERAEDYASARQLIYMLIDIVSRGGNFLLDVGPTADGRIPVIMQDRLLQIGDWLRVNGEAIYGTRECARPFQWSEGAVPESPEGDFQTGYDIMRLTVEPAEGEAVKEAWFTCKPGTSYAITPVLPYRTLRLEDIAVGEDAAVTLLGFAGDLTWEADGDDLLIHVPDVPPRQLPAGPAYAFRVTGWEH